MNLTMPWNTTKQPTNGWTAPVEDVKQQIGQQIDRLAQVAGQVGRDVAQGAANITQEAGSQAAVVARDLGTQAVKASQDAGTQAAAVAREVPFGASTLAQQLMRGAAQIGRELRAIRVTREPAAAQRGPDIMPGVALLAGVGSGLALMFFLDPERGHQRRSQLRDLLTKWTRIGRESAAGKAKDVRTKTVGVMYEARKAVVSRTGGEQTETEELATESPSYSSPTNGNGQATGYESTERPVEQPIS